MIKIYHHSNLETSVPPPSFGWKGPLILGLFWCFCEDLIGRDTSPAILSETVALGCNPSQSLNPRQHLGPYLLAYLYLRHLKRDDPAMPNHLRSDLDQFGQ